MGRISVIVITLLTCAFLAKATLENKKQKENNEVHCWVWFKNINLDQHSCSALYLFQGRFYQLNEKGKEAQPVFQKKGIYPGILQSQAPYSLVFRMDNLLEPEFVAHHVQRVVERWIVKGVIVDSIQFDYDSPSSKLLEYAQFLADVKLLLAQTSISATGLVSWYYDNPKDLALVSEQVDFIAIQLYSVLEPHNGYLKMSKQLSSYSYPYRLGITTHPEFDVESINKGNQFLGFSLFLSK